MSGEPKEFQNLLSLKDPRGSQAGYWASSRRNSWEGDENRSDAGEESSSELGCKLRAILQPSTGSFGSSPSVVRVEKYNAAKRSASGAEDGLMVTTSGGRGDSTGDTSRRGSCCARLKASMDAFTDPEIESLFQQYYLKQKRADFQVLITCGIVFLAHLILLTLPQYTEILTPVFLGVISFLIILLIAGECFCWRLPADSAPWKILPFVGAAAIAGEILIAAGLLASPTTPLTWTILATFFFVVAVPLNPLTLIPLAFVPGVIFLAFFILRSPKESSVFSQTAAVVVLLLGTALLGFGAEIWQKARQRRSFKETRKAFEVKCVIDEQSKKQERLLLSVLPQHVATAMRRDMESGPKDSQFKKIYMSRHENVSILFADIVGFTAISSTYSASELVKILNELFARFDRLAEKYHQLRIKILGDCYYCISGAPEEREDHAILSVHMGLSMVEAIKYVRETTGSPVDMRVGIHTGAVLAGVLGQRQWHYDVYSKDVILANQMESSGMPGRVHISNVTLDCLNGAFEVERAGGEKREEALRQASLTTYFILKVLKPLKPEGAEETNGDIADLLDPEVSDNNVLSRENSVTEAQNQAEPPAKRKESQAKARRKRLLEDLVNREGQRDALKDYVPKIMGLGFRRASFEDQFARQRLEPEPSLVLSALAPLLAYMVTCLALVMVASRHWASALCYLVGLLLLSMFSLLPLSEVEVKIPAVFYKFWRYLRLHGLPKAIFLISALLCIMSLSLGDMMISCFSNSGEFSSFDMTDATSEGNCSWSSLNLAASKFPSMTDYPPPSSPVHADTCVHPGFFSNVGILIFIGIAAVTDLSYLIKMALIFLYAGGAALINVLVIYPNFSHCRSNHLKSAFGSGATPGEIPWEFTEELQTSVSFIEAGFMLAILARQWEKTGRVIFVWALGLTAQRERASAIRRHNQVLVYNILPPHVASYFMQRRPIKHSQLYSQSYARVGVLFASMPNFSDFYSEESVNNQGLECLRFLNEVISDFDALLEISEFRDISKIKTIGSTYMAASGLAPTQRNRSKSGASPIPPADLHKINAKKTKREKIREKWWHLSLLVEFAFRMREALKAINEQSFNNFILKMGINHGPITAGVIGARKPHYDIWGNTVNVASRMESTGRAGFIQVTEETKQILSQFGYIFETRGLVLVKGKGQLMTYYLIGKGDVPTDDADGDDIPDDISDTDTEGGANVDTHGPKSDGSGALHHDDSKDEDIEDIPDDC